MGQTHVLLVDDHPMVRAALRCILQCHPDVTVIGEAGDGRAAVKAVDILRPNVVVMDISMPIMNGIEATCRIKARHPLVTVVGISVNAHPEQRAAMTTAGAALLMRKEDAWDQLHSVIKDTVLTKSAGST